MINKQSIWFTFLFSVILVLSIFYISMGESDLSDFILGDETEDSTLVVNESTELVALRIQSDEEITETINELQEIILSDTADIQAKSDAYDELLSITNNKSMEEKVEKVIKSEFNFDSFAKINGNNITIVVENNEHNYKLANDIISRVAKEFSGDKYITVKFN